MTFPVSGLLGSGCNCWACAGSAFWNRSRFSRLNPKSEALKPVLPLGVSSVFRVLQTLRASSAVPRLQEP